MMNWNERLKALAERPLFNRYAPIGVVWAVAAIAAALLKFPNNNFTIFRHVFWHVWEGLPLYVPYPECITTSISTAQCSAASWHRLRSVRR